MYTQEEKSKPKLRFVTTSALHSIRPRDSVSRNRIGFYLFELNEAEREEGENSELFLLPAMRPRSSLQPNHLHGFSVRSASNTNTLMGPGVEDLGVGKMGRKDLRRT